MLRLLYLILLLAIPFGPLAGQHASPQDDYLQQPVRKRDFDQKQWRKLKEDMDFSKEPEEKRSTSIKGLGPAFKWLLYGIAFALLVWLIVYLASGKQLFSPRNRKLSPQVTQTELEKIEENLPSAELNNPIRRAVAAGDYALAVRLYYLAVLKELSLARRIHWKKDKTNGEYLRELAGSSLFKPVQEATLAFERVWYGKTTLSEADFLLLEQQFKQTMIQAGR